MSTLNGQDDPLVDLIAAKQWKQAFNLCEKKIKKAKDNDLLQVRMITVLLSWPDPIRQAQGVKKLDALLDRKPPLTDIDALLELDKGLKDVKEHERKQLQTWQRAANSRPNDELFYKVWYRSKFDAGNLKAAQQATIIWKKNFPKQRAPYFLYVLVTHLISEQSKDEVERKISEGLVFKNLQAAVDASSDMGIAKPTRAISTMQDLLLLLRIYRAQGKYTDASNVLQNFRNFDFQGIEKEWEVARQMIELFELTQNWPDLYAFCQTILEDARTAVFDPSNYIGPWGKLADDWKVWDGFVTASGKITGADTSSNTQKLIAVFKDEKMNSRNAHLASMKLYHSEAAAESVDSEGLLQAVIEYFERYSTKYSAFQDIRPHLPHLKPQHQLELTQIASQLSKDCWDVESQSDVHKVIVEINVLKLEYHLLVSPDHTRRPKLLPMFISNCLLLYSHSLKLGDNSPPVERRNGDDAALMAAMGLIHLLKKDDESGDPSDKKKWPQTLLRSIAILEYLLSNSPHNYDALLILVRLYMYMGAGSLAMERYSRLSVKNLQYTYMSWVLFSNISTIHPYSAQVSSADGKIQTTFDPLEEIKQMLHWFQGAEIKVKQNTLKMQENGQWEMSMDALSTTDVLSRNFAKHQLFAEAKRINRLTSPSHDVSSHPAFKIPLRTQDMGERVPFPSFEAHSQPYFEEILPIAGPRNPNDTWLEQQLSAARFWDAFHSNGQSPINADQVNFMKQGSARLEKTLTNSELEAGNIIYSLEQLHSVYYLKSSEHPKENIAKCVRQLVTFLEDHVATAYNSLASFGEQPQDEPPCDIYPTGDVLHRQYMCLEICQFMVPVLNYIVAENVKLAHVSHEWLKDTVQRINDRCKNITVDIYRAAEDLKARLSRPTAIEELEEKVLACTKAKESEDTIGYDIQRKFGDRMNVTKVLKDLHASWIDGLDGVIRTKGT